MKNHPGQCKSFVSSKGLQYLLPLLAHANETIRVESTRVLSYLAKEQLVDNSVFKDNLFIRLTVLIDEGLQGNSEYLN